MNAIELVSLALLVPGLAMLLAGAPWFRDRPLVDRLRPYVGGADLAGRREPGTLADVAQVLSPIARDLGARVSRSLGVTSDLSTRLARAGRDTDADSFRLRQLSHAVVALILAGAWVMAVRPNPALCIATVAGAPVLVILGHEHALSRAGEQRRKRLAAELPILVEQLGLLVAAGFSVTGALTRLATRGNGIASQDLSRVLLRIRHGVPERTALADWSELSGIEAIGRVTAILSLHGQTADLGLLIADEARTVRAEAHRELLEAIERRSQLVWIPVTVATLVPGLIFLAVPFMSAMSQVGGGT